MFKKRMAKKAEASTRLKQAKVKSDEHYQADNASLLPRPSDVGTVDTTVRQSRYRVRRDIQSHIPDWIDDVVHARLMEIAESLAQKATSEGAEEVWSPGLPPDTQDVEDEETQEEEARPGSAPEASREESHRDTRLTAIPRRSSVSAPSTRSNSFHPGARSVISPVDLDESPIAPPTIEHVHQLNEVPRGEGKLIRHSRNLSSVSGGTAMSHGTGTSIYSKRSSTSSPGTSVEKRISDSLSTRMTWKDIARKTPIKKPVEAGVLKKVNIHLAKPSTSYSIMSPVNAGVFDEAKSPASANSSTGYSIMSPVQAGVFSESLTDLNKPLPAHPSRPATDYPTTFFVMGDVVHSPSVPKSPELLRSVTYPSPKFRSPRHTQSPRSPKSPKFFAGSKLASSPTSPLCAELPHPQPVASTFEAKKFARLSRPFIEPIYDFPDVLPQLEEESEGESEGTHPVELTEKFLVIQEEAEEHDVQATGMQIANDRSVSPVVVDTMPARPDSSAQLAMDSPPSESPAPPVSGSPAQVEIHPPPVDSPAQIESHPTPSDSPAPPTPVLQEHATGFPVPSPTVSERTASRLSGLISLAGAKIASHDQPATDQSTPLAPSPEPPMANRPISPPTVAIDLVPSSPVEEHSPVSITHDHASTEVDAGSEQRDDGHEDQEHPDEQGDDDLSPPPSPTLSQAEEDLMATLALDTGHKFLRPNSWLADSPTLGNAVLPPSRLEDARPATALGNEINVDDVGRKKKAESHYAFLWSADNGWYVV